MALASLLKILTQNADTEIGRAWNFKAITDGDIRTDTFRKTIPLTTFEDYKPYIDRTAQKGEQNLITSEEIIQLAPSSGTTGQMKLLPLTQSAIKLPQPTEGIQGKVLTLSNAPVDNPKLTPSGLPILGLGVRLYQLAYKVVPEIYVIPAETLNVKPLSEALYCQLIFGLKHNTKVSALDSPFITVLLSGIEQLSLKWPQMLEVIRTGKLNGALQMSQEQRSILEEALGGPDPSQADRLVPIFKEAEKNKFRHFLPSIWPELKRIHCLCSGNLASFLVTLRYYAGLSVHVLSPFFLCSEGLIGFAAKPNEITSIFALNPTYFFEFIPLHLANEDQPDTLLPHEVEEGCIYEIVMTTTRGLYRYRNGDFIKVLKLGAYGPLIDFYSRKKMCLNLHGAKIYESSLEKAMEAITKIAASRVDYVAGIDPNLSKNRIIIWMECKDDKAMTQDGLSDLLDKELQEVDFMYKECRSPGDSRGQPLVIQRVKAGTFDKILSYVNSQTLVGEMQLKLPRVAIKEEILSILQDGEI